MAIDREATKAGLTGLYSDGKKSLLIGHDGDKWYYANVDSNGLQANRNYIWDTASLSWIAATGSVVEGAVEITNFPPTYSIISSDLASVKTGMDAINSLTPSQYDSITLSYTGDNLTGVVYKLGVVTVSTLTLSYDGSNLTSVVKT